MVAILADDIFTCIFVNENDKIPIPILLKYVPMSPIDNKPSLVQGMAWRRSGDKPLPKPMMTQFAALGGDELMVIIKILLWIIITLWNCLRMQYTRHGCNASYMYMDTRNNNTI